MQALVGLFCFLVILVTGTCLECEHCSGFNTDCTGKLKLCDEGQDTCATILTETIIGKMSSFTIVKFCYQASKCLRSSKRNSFVKVNVNIECSSSPVGEMESKGGKAPVHWSNELSNNHLLAEVFNQPKARAAVVFNPNPSDIKFKAVEVRATDPPGKPTETPGKPTETPGKPTDPSGKPTETPGKPTDPPGKPTDPPGKPTDPPGKPTDPPGKPTDPPGKPTDPPGKPTDPPGKPTDPPGKPTETPGKPTDPSGKPTETPGKPTDPSGKPTDPSGKPTETPIKTTKSTTKKPNPTILVTATTGDNAHQTIASFLLALSSLLLMNIFL